MGGPSNKINKPKKPGFRIIQRHKKNEVKVNPRTSKKEKGTFSGGMSKNRRSKGIAKKRKLNVSTNTTPSGKKLRKLLKTRLRNEREANEMQVELMSVSRKQSRKSNKSKSAKQSTQGADIDSGGGADVDMAKV
ncbi:uncharacterized protein LOC119720384 isoform X2 [Patiria miniata]|uniref:Uncharacterized protein n=1 Tax=Patiria miniata TaxID=46514 RepID=A0A913Z5D3_PATMI|nr:uncharacterized protein LOC119720384 isoform X2 [Patiria miniata]